MDNLLHQQSDLLHEISIDITDEKYKALMENLGKLQAAVTAPRAIEYCGFRPVNIFTIPVDEDATIEEMLPFRHIVRIKDDAHRAKLLHFKERFERRDYEAEADAMEDDDDDAAAYYSQDEDDDDGDYDDDYSDEDGAAADISFSYYNNMIKIYTEELDGALFGDLEELFRQQTALIMRVAQVLSDDDRDASYIAQGGVAYITAINLI